MSKTGVLDLWSDDIRVTVLPPVAILRAQVAALSRKTEGLLRAEVGTDINQEKVELSLDLIAPVLNEYRITLLNTWHDTDLVYPATVKSRGLLPPQAKRPQMPLNMVPAERNTPPDERIAETQEEFITILGEILKSGWVRSLLQSLIARSNEMLAEKAKPVEASENSEAHPDE